MTLYYFCGNKNAGECFWLQQEAGSHVWPIVSIYSFLFILVPVFEEFVPDYRICGLKYLFILSAGLNLPCSGEFDQNFRLILKVESVICEYAWNPTNS